MSDLPPPRVRNPYFLLTYGWQDVLDPDFVQTGSVGDVDSMELVARVFLRQAAKILARGMDRGYLVEEEETRRPRGRVLAVPTMSRLLLHRGLVACETQAFTPDVPHNRAMRGWLGRLARCNALRAPLRAEASRLHGRMGGIGDIVDLRKLQLHRNIAHYGAMIRLGQMLDACLLPTPDGARWMFPDTARDDLMGQVFEGFVREVLRAHGYPGARKEQRSFADVVASPRDARFLPQLETDVTLRSATQHLVLETKFYRSVLVGRPGAAPKLRSSHIYQLLAYLRNARPTKPGVRPEGVLVYAQTDRALQLEYEIDGFRLRVRTLDLDQQPQDIIAATLALVGECSAPNTQ